MIDSQTGQTASIIFGKWIASTKGVLEIYDDSSIISIIYCIDNIIVFPSV